jgi:hypothetical protein
MTRFLSVEEAFERHGLAIAIFDDQEMIVIGVAAGALSHGCTHRQLGHRSAS